MRTKRILFILAVVLSGFAITIFVKSYNFSPKVYKVALTKDGFVPSDIAIRKGDSVEFTSELGELFWPASDPHPLHNVFPVFDPKKPVSPGSSWKFKFSKVGSWNYHDHLFPSYRGKITVLNSEDFEIRNKILTRDELRKLIDKDGPEKTYSVLKRIYDKSTDLSVHTTFHLFGEILYAKSGLDGITYCDDFAGFGCYHGLFIKAVGDSGLDVAVDLDKKCTDKFGPKGLGCPHGIGHGLVEYFGLGKINEALSICSKLTWQGEFFGCSGGVFMENNFPTIFDSEGVGKVTTRENQGDLFEPCLSSPDKFKQACYFEQASWWNQIYSSDYAKIGKLCSSLKNENQREACLLGLGNSSAELSNYSLDKVVAACYQMPDKNTEAICRAGASWAFFANPMHRDSSESLCNDLGVYEKKCMDNRILVK